MPRIKKARRAICVVILLVLIAVAVAACPAPQETTTPPPGTTTPPPETTAPAPKHLKVGAIVPISGPLSMVGLAFSRGYEMLFNKVNEQGGIQVGEDTYLIDLLVEDDKFSPDAAASAANKLVLEENVKFVFGGLGSDVNIEAIYDVTRSAGDVLHSIIWLPAVGGITDVSVEKPMQVRLATCGVGNLRPLYDYATETYPDVENVLLVIPEMPFVCLDYLGTVIEDHGLEHLGIEAFPMQTTDFAPLWTRILEYEPDAVHIVTSGQVSPNLKVARELGFTGLIISDSPEGPDIMLRLAGPEACTDIICCGVDVEGPNVPAAMLEVVDSWNASYTDPFISDSLQAYDEAWALVQAIEKAQSVDAEVVYNTLTTMSEPGSIETVFGPGYMGGSELDMIGANLVVYKPWPISRVMNGQGELVKFVDSDFSGYFLD